MGDFMKKLLVMPKTLDEINKLTNSVDGFIIGIKNFCINTNYEIDDLSILKKINSKEIFISINKILSSEELDEVKKIMLDLNNYNIKAVMYYDIAILSFYNELNLNYDLVWDQEHATTNYNTINYYYDKGVKYTHISNDITYKEIKNITKNTDSKLMLTVFGYLPMFASKRHIVKNYLDYFKLSDDSSINYIEKEDKEYPIIDSSIGTVVYSNNILNGIKEYFSLDIDYGIINSFNIDFKLLLKVINLFKEANDSNVLWSRTQINKMFKNIDYGFFYTETIYKVKKND